MEEETRELLSRIPEEFDEILTDGELEGESEKLYRRYESVGRATATLITSIQEAALSGNDEDPMGRYYNSMASDQRDYISDFDTPLPDDSLSLGAYVLQPEDCEALTSSQLASLTYAYCGALHETEETEDRDLVNVRGVMVIKEFLQSLNAVERPLTINTCSTLLAQYRQLRHELSGGNPLSLIMSDIENKIEYTFENDYMLYDVLWNRLLHRSQFRERLRCIGRFFINYVLAVWHFDHGASDIDSMVARYSCRRHLANIAISFELNILILDSLGSYDLTRTLIFYRDHVRESPDAELIIRATNEISDALMVVVGAVFVDGDFTTACRAALNILRIPVCRTCGFDYENCYCCNFSPLRTLLYTTR